MKEDMTHSFCGSAEYMAPEMLMKYWYIHLEKDIAIKSTTIASAPCSMSY